MANPNLMNATTMYGKTYRKLLTNSLYNTSWPRPGGENSYTAKAASLLDNDTNETSLLIKNPVGSNDLYKINSIKRSMGQWANGLAEAWWIIFSKYNSGDGSYDHQFLHLVYDPDTNQADAGTIDIVTRETAFYLEEGDKISAGFSEDAPNSYIDLVINYDIISDQ